MEVYARHYARLKYTAVNKSYKKSVPAITIFNGKKCYGETFKIKNVREY